MDSKSQHSSYTLAQAAEVLGVHYETVARWVRSGKLPGVRLSRRKVLVPKQACELLLSSGSAAIAKRGPQVGSPQCWLALVGTLTPKEAAKLRVLAQDFEELEDED
jgi:excisionase family DNA binding protein